MLKTIFIATALLFSVSSCETLSRLPIYTTVTESEAAEGMRQALGQGISKGVTFLNRQDGFFGNQAYKLFLPEEARRIESTLRQLGMDGIVDRAILQINRAAEDAVGHAMPIFGDAIRAMTITDAINIIKGPNDAATQYFRQKTHERLVAAFTPVVKSSLEKFSATKYYNEVINTYNNFPTTINKLNPDLPSYVVGKAIDALFDQVAQEEANIRANPVARTTEILRKVFGWAATNR